MLIAGLPGANGIDVGLSKELNIDLTYLETKVFPDGESYIRFTGNLVGSDLILVQTLYPQQDKRIFELILAIDTAKELGCRKVILVIPYLAYSRQDRAFLSGEAVSIKTLLKTLSSLGADYLITVDVHKGDSLKFFSGTAVNVNPVPLFARELSKVTKNPLVVAPDEGASSKAFELSRLICGAEYVVFKKYRDRVTGLIRHEYADVDVRGRDAIVIDDIISTGSTVASIASYLVSRGASNVYVVCSHGLFIGDSLTKILSSGASRIYALNTVPTPQGVSVIDVTPLIATSLRDVITNL